MNIQSRSCVILSLLIILLLAFGLRAYRLAEPSLRGDESFSVTFARQELGLIWRTLIATEPHPPLYYSSLHLWMKAAGQSELTVRLFSTFFGVLLVPLTYRLGRTLFEKEEIALVAAMLVAVNPYLVWHSQDARMYTLLAATATASFLLAVRSWQLGGGGAWAGYVAITLMALYSHYGAIFVLLIENLVFLLWLAGAAVRGQESNRTGGQKRAGEIAPSTLHPSTSAPLCLRWLLAQLLIVVVYLPWAALAASIIGHAKGWIVPVSLTTLLKSSLVTYSLGATGGPQASSLATGFLVMLLWGTWWALRVSPTGTLMAGTYLLVPLLVGFGVSLGRLTFDERYFLFVIPAYALLLAWGMGGIACALPSNAKGVRAAGSVVYLVSLIFLLWASTSSLSNQYFNPEYAKSPGWRPLVQSIFRRARPGDTVIQNFPDPSLTYYLDGRLPLVVLPSSVPLQVASTDRELERVLNASRRLWFLPYASPGWDEDGYVEKWLDSHAVKMNEEVVGDIRLFLYEGKVSP